MAVCFAQAWLAGANQCGPVKIGFSAAGSGSARRAFSRK